ncbi:MAG TPA: hypothetical protein VFN35_16015 [Ktedonobacteraceae bacterium]|nr:hypothetical protein [Ktedonobacteraceae bacterium]
MSIDAFYEKREDLLVLAQQRGFTITTTQLVRWHRAGLLPRPRQLPLKGVRGTGSFYPNGTGEQLILLCSLRTTERRFSHLAWKLWLAGYLVDLHIIRNQLMHAATRLTYWMQWFAEFQQIVREEDISGEILDRIENYALGSLSSPLLRRVRKRIGRQHFSTFLLILLDLAVTPGKEQINSYDEREQLLDLRILALGLGLEKRFVRKKDSLKYYLLEVIIPLMRRLFSELQEVSWESLLTNATNFDLLQTRDDLSTWLMRWENARQSNFSLPDDYPRWNLRPQSLFQALSVSEQACVLIGWLALWTISSSRRMGYYIR